MALDWNVVATIASPLIAGGAGALINHWFSQRPKLISYFGAIGAHRILQPGQSDVVVHTHEVVLRNVSRQLLTNIRLAHHQLPPNIDVRPSCGFTLETTLAGVVEMVIPRLVPHEQIAIAYLYYAPLLFNQIHAGIKCDQGIASAVPVLLQQQSPKWLRLISGLLRLVGGVAAVYVAYVAVVWLIAGGATP